MFRALFFLLLGTFLSSCSSVSESLKPADVHENMEEQTVTESEVLEPESEEEAEAPEVDRDEITAIEIEWRAPKTKVIRYILRYGKSPDKLDAEETIELSQLKVEHHALHGKLYKYLLLGLPDKTVVYYTLQAENEFGLSEPTPVAKEEVRQGD